MVRLKYTVVLFDLQFINLKIPGLSIMAFVNQSDYMPTSSSAGLKIIIQNQDEPILPDVTGLLTPVGFYSSFAISKVLNNVYILFETLPWKALNLEIFSTLLENYHNR